MADAADRTDLDQLREGLLWFIQHMKEHALLEETIIHPKLGQIAPGIPRLIEADHKLIQTELRELLEAIDAITDMPTGHPLILQLWQETYLAANRFISFYLKHIDFEEDHAQQILLNCSTPEETLDMFQSVLSSQTQDQLEDNLMVMLSGANVAEASAVLAAGKHQVSKPTYLTLLSNAKRTIEPERWVKIETRLPRD